MTSTNTNTHAEVRRGAINKGNLDHIFSVSADAGDWEKDRENEEHHFKTLTCRLQKNTERQLN